MVSDRRLCFQAIACGRREASLAPRRAFVRSRELGVSSRAVAELLRFGTAVRRAATRISPITRNIVFVMNANDHTVKTSPAVELARRWSQDGVSVVVYQFPRSLGLPHDIAEEAHPNADPAVVYPALEALMHGERPPPVLACHRLWPP